MQNEYRDFNSNENEYTRFIKDFSTSEEVVFFGIGKMFDYFIVEVLPYLAFENKHFYCVDNSDSKRGMVIDVNHKSLLVHTMDDLSMHIKQKPYCKRCFVVMIVSPEKLIQQVISEIGIVEEDIHCFREIYGDYLEIKDCNVNIPEDLRRRSEMLIPKKIHYCWFGGKDIPEHLRRCINSWKKYCPDYEIIRWDENNYDVHKIDYISQAYNDGQWAFVSDYARLDIIYQFGGVYLDTDVELIRNIDELLYQDGFLGLEKAGKVATGLGFGAICGNRLIKSLRDVYLGLRFDVNNKIPCPVIQSATLKEKGLEESGEYQVIDGVAILPVKVLNGINMYSKKVNVTDRTFAMHHGEASWNEAWKSR